MKNEHRVKCPTCMVPRGVACRRVRITDSGQIDAWLIAGVSEKTATHRARKENADRAARKRGASR